MEQPEINLYDFTKMDWLPQLHLAFRALAQFSATNNRLPEPYAEQDAAQVIEFANKINSTSKSTVEKVDDKLLRLIAYQSQGQLNPMATLFGGIVAQEALKATTHKFTPVQQWIYFESLLSLPKTLPTAEEAKPVSMPYH